MISSQVAGAIVIALIGWFATIRLISTARWSTSTKQLLLVASWVPWLVAALGAPILAGYINLSQAINIGGAITMGMAVSVVVSWRQRSNR